MPRRVLMLSDDDIRRHELDTTEGVRAFMRARMPDHEAWMGSVRTHTSGQRVLVLDHLEPTKPLHELQPYHHGGRRLPDPGGFHRRDCAELGCPKEAIYGTSHCVRHMTAPPGYGDK
jgi:hypothetical protein